MKKSGTTIVYVIICIGLLVAAYGIGICIREIRFYRARFSKQSAIEIDSVESITVTVVNDRPTAQSGNITTSEDVPIFIILAGVDPDGDSLTYNIVTKPSHGNLSGTEPNLTYTPNPDFNGQDQFSFKVHDGIIDSDLVSISIWVAAVDDVPRAKQQIAKLVEDTTASITLMGDDPDGDSLNFKVVKAPSRGTLDGTAPNLTYRPDPNVNGEDRLVFIVSDGKAESEPATVSIVITPLNDRPIAQYDGVSTLEDMPARIVLAGIDPDGDYLTYSIATEPSHGRLSGTEPNLTYTPNPDFSGQDTFTFIVHDGVTDSTPANISISVKAVEDVPTAKDINVELKEDASVPITLSGIDPEGDPLTFRVVKDPNHGRLSGETPNLTYTPNPNFSGLDSFSFIVNDGKTLSKPCIVTISVTSVNDPPVAKDDSITTQEDAPAIIDVLANDIEIDDEALKISRVTQGTNGSVTINTDDTLTYQPHSEFHGEDQFTYTMIDEEGEMNTATVKVVVSEMDDLPTITSQPLTTAKVNVLYQYDVAANDPDGTNELMYSLTQQPSGMRIDPLNGLIEWIPNETHKKTAHRVEVKVFNRNDISALVTQTFSINVIPPPPKITTLNVMDGYDQRNKKRLSVDGTTGIVQASDGRHQEISGGGYIAYDFVDIAIPTNATLISVVVCVEHYEQGSISTGKLQWAVGANWPNDPKVWISVKAPTRKGKQNESMDCWDVTSFVDTPEKLRTFQLQIENGDRGSRKKTMIDQVYLVVKWDWVVPAPKSNEPDTGLVRYGPSNSEE
ncbi:Ig-like domain-containing protein [Planctomycetota bacterium]